MAVPRSLRGRSGPIQLSADPPRRGGQAKVYRGRDAAGRTVAVKIALDGDDERRGLAAEREALKAIHSRQPGGARWLVPILDDGDLPDGRPFLVLPWYEHSMQSWLRAQQPTLRRRLRALVLTSEAVVQLHRSAASLAGVVLHRDLKPGNLLIEEDGDELRVVLADLGGAKERTLHDATRNTGIHTPWFAPLEQMLPLERPPDPSVDVHALAVVIYNVVVGRPPQVVLSRTGLLTQAAEDLVELHKAGGGRTPAEKARYVELRRAPLERLIELDHAVALPEDDCNRLRQALAQQMSELGDLAEALADALTEVLVPPLRHALEPNPKMRLSRPEVLLAALHAAEARLPAVAAVVEVATEAGEQAPSPGVDTPPVTPAVRRGAPPRGRWRWSMIAGLGAGLAVGCAGLAVLPPAIAYLRGPAPTAPSSKEPEALPDPRAGSEPAGPSAMPILSPPAPSPEPSHGSTLGATGTRASSAPKAVPEVAPETVPGSTTEPPKDLPPPQPTTAPIQPSKPSTLPILVISVAPARGTSPYVWLDGELVASAKPWRGSVEARTHSVEVRERSDGPIRSFRIDVSPEDATHWGVQIADEAGPGQRKEIEVPATGAPRAELIQWCADNSVRFGCPSSSDP